MDKRFKPLTPAEELRARRSLSEELEASPGLAVHVVVKKIRSALRLTITEYARLCGVSARALADIERGDASPTLVTVEKLLKPMGLRVGVVAARKAEA